MQTNDDSYEITSEIAFVAREWSEGDIEALFARQYFNDTNLSASTDGIEVREHHLGEQFERDVFMQDYCIARS